MSLDRYTKLSLISPQLAIIYNAFPPSLISQLLTAQFLWNISYKISANKSEYK